MGTIPTYNPGAEPYDGSELLLGYEGGKTSRLRTGAIASLALRSLSATNITYDAGGGIISLTAANVAAALTYTPANASGQMFSGAVGVVKSSGDAHFILDAPSGNLRSVYYRVAGVTTFETGVDGSGNLFTNRYVGGSYVDTPYSINPSTGVVGFAQRTLFGINTPWDSGNLNPALKANLSDLANPSDTAPGTKLITSSAYRTLQQALSTFGVNVMDKGAKGDSTGSGSSGTDDTAAIIAAFNTGARVIRFPSDTGGKFRVTARLQPNIMSSASRSLKIIGDGCEGHVGTTTPDGTLPGNGSWLYFDHADEGLHLEQSSGNEIRGIGSIRNQPANINSGSVTASISSTTMTVTVVGSGKVNLNAVISNVANTVLPGTKILSQLTSTESGGALGGRGTYSVSQAQTVASGTIAIGWVPGLNPFDWTFLAGDFYIDDLFGWNPTNFLATDYNGAGRVEIGRLHAAPFACGLQIDRQYDAFRAQNVHLWPFANFGGAQAQYAYANLIGIHMLHADGAFIDNVFSIGTNISLLLSGGADSNPPRDIKIGKLYADLVGHAGIVADASCPSGGSFSVGELVTQGAVSGDSWASGAYAGAVIAAAGFIAKIGRTRYTRFNQEMAIVTGAGSTLYQGPDTLDAWNQSGVAAPAYAATGSGSRIIKPAPSTVLANPNGTPVIDNSGRIAAPETVTQAVTTTATSGSGFTMSGTAIWSYDGVRCTINLVLTDTTNGSGSGAIRATLPVQAMPGTEETIAGTEVVTGKAVIGRAQGGFVDFRFYDGSYPGANGAQIKATGSYLAAAL